MDKNCPFLFLAFSRRLRRKPFPAGGRSMEALRQSRLAVARILPIVFAVFVLDPMAPLARALTAGDFEYQLINSDTEAEIIGYNCAGGDLAIPARLNGKPVTSIGDEAFRGCAALTSVVIPDGVTTIGLRAFMGCSGLNSVEIPGSVTVLGAYAFAACSGLTSLSLPDGVTEIGSSAFVECSGLTSMSIPESVTIIGYWAFSSCTGLTSVTLPGTLKRIGDGTFSGCAALTDLEIPSGVTIIGASAFANCARLRRLAIPSAVTLISSGAFSGCSDLLSVAVPDGVIRIEINTFSKCANLQRVSLPDSVTYIGGSAFSECSSLQTITIPVHTTYVGNVAFYKCTALTRAYFAGNAPATVGSYVFDNTAPGFTVYFLKSSTGFSKPRWRGYPSVEIDALNPSAENWRILFEIPESALMAEDLNGDGVPLLVAYALGLDPNLDLAGRLPRPLLTGSVLELPFFGGRSGIVYGAESSLDLRNWSEEGVTLSEPDAEGNRTARVEISRAHAFLRLTFTER